MAADEYEVYAIKYSTREELATKYFYGPFHQPTDPHENQLRSMDYYIWVAKSATNTVVIDVGFNETVAKKRGRNFLRCPVQTLNQLGIEAEKVQHVVVTHLHYDHVGNLDKFPNAHYYIQESEMAFWTGKNASRQLYKAAVEVEDVVYLVRENFESRVKFVNGEKEILPGITLYHVGGHAPGLQMAKVNTKNGSVILASDACHFYQNFEEDRPFSTVHNLAELYESFDLIKELSDSSTIMVPGHDPEVMNRFPAASAELESIAVKIS